MLLSIFLALFLPCAGMSIVVIIYISLLCYAACQTQREPANKPETKPGLTKTEFEKLPEVTGDRLLHGNECAICLDKIGDDEPARMVPGCNHGFHVYCADTWLEKQPFCPVCRTKLGPEFFEELSNPC